MVISKISQGLGNQMFQYAAGKALSLKHSTTFKLDISGYNSHSYRQFELSKYFAITAGIATEEEIAALSHQHPVRRVWNKLFPKHRIKMLPYEEAKAARLVYKLVYLMRPAHRQKTYEEKAFSADKNFYNTKTDVYLRGYWMSYKYFTRYDDIIKKDFTIQPQLIQHLKALATRMQDEESIAIHVRCTDKKNVAKYYALYGEISRDYYTKAVNHIAAQGNAIAVKLYIFSDDIEVAKTYVPDHFDTTYISTYTTKTPVEDMYLMMQCRHIVIANSTFSWWAAYLNIHSNGVKVIPTPWYAKNQYNSKDLYVPGWTVIENKHPQ